MAKKKKIIHNFFHIKIIFFLLSIFTLQANAETKIITKNDDTLLKLSKQYGVSLKELMHKNNVNDANRTLEGQIIILPLNNSNKGLIHKVKEGDTLLKIARAYNVNVKDIISINNLDKSSILKPNQIILLPTDADYNKVNRKDIKLASKKVFYHQTSKAEELNEIAQIHNVSIEEIITLNKLNNPTNVDSNIKLKIRKNTSLRWLRYGSLIINWSDWTYSDGNYITQAKNKNNKSFYLALNCSKRALNNTLNNSYWTNWYFPKSDFEFKIINDFCVKDT